MGLRAISGRVEYRPGRWSRAASWVTAGGLISGIGYGVYNVLPTVNTPFEVAVVAALGCVALLFAYMHFRWIRCFVVADEVGLIVGSLWGVKQVQWDEIRAVERRSTEYWFIVVLRLADDRTVDVPALEQPNWFDTRGRRRVTDAISDELERRHVPVRAD